MDTGCPLMVAFGVDTAVGVVVGVALEDGKTVEVGLALGVGIVARGAASSTSSALSLPCVRVPATRTRSPRFTPSMVHQADCQVRVVGVIVVTGCVVVVTGCVTAAVELATVIV